MDDSAHVIGFAGLATSHPYSDARSLLAARPSAKLHVWEPDEERRGQFLDLYSDTTVHLDLDSLAASGLDGAVVSVRPPEVAQVASRLSAVDIPLFINKPAAATSAQIDVLDAVLGPIEHRVLSSSVLRFAPAVSEFRRSLEGATILTARVTVRHDVSRWLHGGTPWQDDVETGGGAIVTLAIHGVELLFSFLGQDARVVSASSATRVLKGLRSEDCAVATILWSEGILGVVEVIGVAIDETYDLIVETTEGPHHLRLPGQGADPLGYESTIRAFLGMVDDRVAGRPIRSPVPWSETRAILRTTTEAARSARGETPRL